MTKRHNAVQLKVVEAIVKYKKIDRNKICENNAIRLNSENWKKLEGIGISDEFDKLRSDVWVWMDEE
jgi:hypothetical protein